MIVQLVAPAKVGYKNKEFTPSQTVRLYNQLGELTVIVDPSKRAIRARADTTVIHEKTDGVERKGVKELKSGTFDEAQFANGSKASVFLLDRKDSIVYDGRVYAAVSLKAKGELAKRKRKTLSLNNNGIFTNSG